MNPAAFVISRHLKAPRQPVWDVYSQDRHLQNWFSPKGVSMSHAAMDFRLGGTFHYCQALEGGGAHWGLWQFRESSMNPGWSSVLDRLEEYLPPLQPQ